MPTSRAQRKALWVTLMIGLFVAIVWIFLLPKRVPSDTIRNFGASTDTFTQEAGDIWTQTQESRNTISEQIQYVREQEQLEQDTTDNSQSPTPESLNSSE